MKTIEEIISDLNVAVYHDAKAGYPDRPPFSPHIKYPEYSLDDTNAEENRVYNAVRNSLFLLGMDKDNFNTALWNPFKEIIKPRNTVVIKPNFVLSNHEKGGDLFSIITHPSVIRAIVDYVYIALAGKGRIIIADAPQMDCDFKELLERTNLCSIKKLYEEESSFNIEIYDLRNFWLEKKNNIKEAYSTNRHNLPGDPLGGVLVNLGRDSFLYGVDKGKKFYGADYNREETNRHHHKEVHEYLISKTMLSADAVISVPKLKVHKKVGVTLNIKGLVGTCVNKNYLVHYTVGMPSKGGDQFPKGVLDRRGRLMIKLQGWAYDFLLSRKNPTSDLLYKISSRIGKIVLGRLGFKLKKEVLVLNSGNWYGNDSAWRMTADLLRIFFYADKNGKLHEMPVRRMFSIVDGIVGGEKNGPLTPDRKKCGLIISGFNFCAIDLVCARLMGFDYKKIKMLNHILNQRELFKTDVNRIKISGNNNFGNLFDRDNADKYFNFEPHAGWKNFIEHTGDKE